MAARGIWILALIAALGFCGAMVFWSLPHLTALAGGLAPFDLRPLGYDTAEAQALVSALGAEGREFYLRVQHRLDAFYPPMLAVVLGGAALRLAPGALGWILALTAGLTALADWSENLTVAALLRAGAEGFDPALAARASMFTLAKSMLTTMVMIALMALVFRALWRRRRVM